MSEPTYLDAANLALLNAAIALDAQGIRDALAAGANVDTTELREDNQRDENSKIIHGATALIYACWNGPDALECANILLEAKANVHVTARKMLTPIYAAALGSSGKENCDKDAKPLIDALVAAGADAKQPSPKDDILTFTPLSVTIGYEGTSLSAFKALLEHGANPNTPLNLGNISPTNSLLTYCIYNDKIPSEKKLEVVKALLAAGATVTPEVTVDDYVTFLSRCHESVHQEVADKARELRNQDGRLPLTSLFHSPIFCATRSGNTQLFTPLLEAGADLTQKTFEGETPLTQLEQDAKHRWATAPFKEMLAIAKEHLAKNTAPKNDIAPANIVSVGTTNSPTVS